MADQKKVAVEKPATKEVVAEKPVIPEVKQNDWKRYTDKVAIVGCSDSKTGAPFDDDSWELWGVNNLFFHIPRWTRWFEIHNIQFDGQKWLRRGSPDFRGQTVSDYIAGISQMKSPVYMQKKWPQIPTSAAYPVKKIIDHFGDYFTNTISWMIALAIWMGYKEIGIWGVDMAVDSEYFWQRPSCEFFLGWAKGAGINMHVCPTSDLLKIRYLYGFQEPEMDNWRKKMVEIKTSMAKRANEAKTKMDQEQQRFWSYQGAMQAAKEIDKIWK